MERSPESQARLDYLLKLRKGLGWGRRAHYPQGEPPRDLFRVREWTLFGFILESSIEAVKDERARRALKNALGELEEAPNGVLKDRRQWLMDTDGLSRSTVIRDENRGFEALADVIDEQIEASNPYAILHHIIQDLHRLHELTDHIVPIERGIALVEAVQEIGDIVAGSTEYGGHIDAYLWTHRLYKLIDSEPSS